ncbi:helix-turn-helix domain-containing protein [Desulfonema magnum]|uniref:HTH domain-containing protein, Cro/C1-type n=1 Tax=Desulfonema magnum TaxID=45655 RepID=A0A975GK58_9BACT|nr:helix-turn-helix transcriptional regulator [Desulfonema magnum]QTA84165.1 HTH domain-containing protein, Cro/C1-type [Desulfonema magnum]
MNTSEPTKKLRTDNPVELRFVGPSENRDKVVRYLKRMGFTDMSDSVPFREAFLEDYEENELPGLALVGARYKEDLTQKELSKLTGIPQGHISQMENGKRPIGKAIAKKLGKALNISYKVFL